MNKIQSRVRKVIAMIISGITIFILGALITLLITSGIFVTPSYLEPWQQSYAQTFDDPRIQLAAHGLLAANGHNMQPWQVMLDADPNIFYLYVDGDHLTPQVDPFARQTMITQGTFLEYVRVAGEQLGYQTDIELFPEGVYDEQNLLGSMTTMPVARITLHSSEPTNNHLYQYMFLADTNRAAYQEMPLTSDQIQQLQAVNTDTDMTIMIFEDAENRQRLGDYALEGAEVEAGIHRIYEESAAIFRSNEYQKNEFRYGFSVEGQGTTGIMRHILQGMVTLFPSFNSKEASAAAFVSSTRTAIAHTPAYGLIITSDNSRLQQVRSGMLYSRFILTAHSLGLVMQPPSQVLEEYPEMSELYNQIHDDYAPDGGTIQMFFRIGEATQDYTQTMRRDVMELVVVDSSF